MIPKREQNGDVAEVSPWRKSNANDVPQYVNRPLRLANRYLQEAQRPGEVFTCVPSTNDRPGVMRPGRSYAL